MTPEAIDLMQREKLTKMVMKDYFLDNKKNDSILKMGETDILQEAKILEKVIFMELIEDLHKDELYFGSQKKR